MQLLRKIRISIKATIMMVVLFGGAISLGSFALFEVFGLAENAGTLQSDVDGLRQIASAIDDADQIRAVLNMLPYARDAAEREEYSHRVKELRLDLQKNWDAYSPNTIPGEERDLAGVVAQRLNDFDAGVQKLAALAQTDKQTELASMLRGDFRQSGLKLGEALAGSMRYQTRESDAAIAEASSEAQVAWIGIVAGLGAIFVLCIACGVFLLRGICRPITVMTQAMSRLADNDLTVQIPGVGRGDEIGGMANAVQVFKDNMTRSAELVAEQQQQQAAKDRRQAALDRHTTDFGTSIASVMGGLLEAAETMRRAAVQVSGAASQTSDATSGVVQGAESSARDLSSVASSVEQLAASIAEISGQIATVTGAVRTAVERAAETDEKVAGLAAAAGHIGEVVSLINNIAGQTNLLALNATIEAARAGEAGKGFAVVAGEVKALAAQTAKATSDISTHIAKIHSATDEAVTAVRQVSSAIGEVDNVATAIAAAVEEQNAATRHISQSVQSVSLATGNATATMQSVLSIAGESEKAADFVRSAAEDVGKTSQVLQQEVTDFLTSVSSLDDNDRRKYERISGNGAEAELSVSNRARVRAAIVDISRGGVALRLDASEPAGKEVELWLPGVDTQIHGRVVRCDKGAMAICFRQNGATLAAIDRFLSQLQVTQRAA
jgi:methyl-accepting chemotaxis protein